METIKINLLLRIERAYNVAKKEQAYYMFEKFLNYNLSRHVDFWSGIKLVLHSIETNSLKKAVFYMDCIDSEFLYYDFGFDVKSHVLSNKEINVEEYLKKYKTLTEQF